MNGRRAPTRGTCLRGLAALAALAAACKTPSDAPTPAPVPDAAIPTDGPSQGARRPFEAEDLGTGALVRLTLEPPGADAAGDMLILRREDAFPDGPGDRRAVTVHRGPFRTTIFDSGVASGHTYFYTAFLGGATSRRSFDGKARVHVGVLPVTELTVSDPGLGGRLELTWREPESEAVDFVRVFRFAGACAEAPDATGFERRVDLAAGAPGDRRSWTDDEVADGVESCYAVFVRAGVHFSPGAFASGRSSAALRPPDDADRDGFREDQGDCNDADGWVHPGALSLDCSATDWDCDGAGWDDAFCTRTAPAWLDDQCARRLPAYDCVEDSGCNWHVKPDHSPCRLATEPDFSHDICVAGACRSPGTCGSARCNSPGPHYRLPPAAGHVAFVRTGGREPLVTDEVTGLVWQGCPAGLSGADCSTGTAREETHAEALVVCDGLTWAGHDDWRLPAPDELLSIIDYDRFAPAVDPTVFPATSDYFWSLSLYAAGSTIAWVVHFASGHQSYSDRDQRYRVRCVRGGSPSGPAGETSWRRFRRDEPTPGQPVVADTVTALLWQGCTAGRSGRNCTIGEATFDTWDRASAFCETLDWGGFDDWRLPDVRELASLLDTHVRSPAIDPLAFPATTVGWYWSSTPWVFDPPSIWQVNFSSGHVGTGDKPFPCNFRCVRTGP
ncbi:MAG: DUF1566 domain-containing protein [Deltaproteobacteria bacterium]|nr:DUF1566 domain-containing protein [Deltaproteobacteria bacterium]